MRLQGWEDFDGHADRIVGIGAFEHFQLERYDDFFGKCAAILPPDGRLLLHKIVGFGYKLREMGIPITREDIQLPGEEDPSERGVRQSPSAEHQRKQKPP